MPTPRAVTLAAAATPKVVEKSLPLSYSRFYEFKGVRPGVYLVRLACSLDAHAHVFSAEARRVTLDHTSHALAPPLSFHVQPRLHQVPDVSQTSCVPLMLALLTILGVANWESVQHALARRRERVRRKSDDDGQWLPSTPGSAGGGSRRGSRPGTPGSARRGSSSAWKR